MVQPTPRRPQYVVLTPKSTVRVAVELESAACELNVELENPKPGRSFVLMIGNEDGRFLQKMRLARRARIFFDPEEPGEYALFLTNPSPDPEVIRLRARPVRARTGARATASSAKREKVPPGESAPTP